jgi:succinate-semialdehyde dehydrogenase/glutarate-semialdehyde dehydrogenase
MGNTAQAEGEIELSADIFDYYANHGWWIFADKILDPEHWSAIVRTIPLESCLRDALEFSLLSSSSICHPNIMVGNNDFAKHSLSFHNVPLLLKTFWRSRSPEGLYTNLFISGNALPNLVADKRIKGSFTNRKQEPVLSRSWKTFEKVVLELGGNDVLYWRCRYGQNERLLLPNE